MSEIFRMGGYGVYIWISYGLALFILVLNIWLPLSCERRLLRRLARQAKGKKA